MRRCDGNIILRQGIIVFLLLAAARPDLRSRWRVELPIRKSTPLTSPRMRASTNILLRSARI